MTLSLEIAKRAADTRFHALQSDVVDAVKVSLADGLAVMAAASGLEPAAMPFAAHAMALGGGGRSTLVGHKTQATAPMAALANGALAHAVDFEDTFEAGKVHPNAAVIPAVLALAEETGASGHDVIVALALGCDLSCRLSLALDANPAEHGWYHPPMLTAIGAALACAKLLSLPPEAIVDAIALASCQFALSDELKRSPQSDLRAVRDGFAARAAVEAALLAQRGVRGVEKPLEGKSGLIAMLTGRPSLREACLVDGFGEQFHGPTVGIKRWPSCRGTHSAIAAAHALRQMELRPDGVGSVSVIVTPPNDMLFLPRAQRVWPHTAIDAKFSIPFVFASTMVHGTIGLESFLPERLSEAQIRGLAEKVTLSEVIQTDAFEARYKVRTCDGHEIEETVAAIPVWHASDIALQDLKGKVAGCAGVARTPFEAEAFLSAVSMTDTAGIEPVMAML